MKQAQETSDFYPTRRASEAPPEHVIGGGFKPDLSDTPDLPESGVTLKHVRETVRGIMTALKGTATLLAVAASCMLMAESITGTEGEMLENLPGDSTVILDAPAVKQLLQGKADAGALSGISEQLTAHSKQLTALEAQVPVVRATLGAANNNANGYGYRGPLSRLGVYGEAVVVRRLAITTRASGNQNTTVPLWARVVRNVDGAWVVCAQAKEPRKWDEVAPGAELAWEMEAVPGVLPPSADEEVAIVWVNDPDAPAAQSDGQVSWRTVSVAGGLGFALPTVPTTSSSIQSWSPRIVLDFTAVTKALEVEGSVTTIDETTTFTSSDGATTMTLPWNAEPNSYSEDGAVGVAAIYGSGLDGFAVTDGKGNAVDFIVSGSNYGSISVKVDSYDSGQWSRYVLPKAIDSSLNATSTNPVQNKVIKAALDTLQQSGNTEVWRGNVGFGEQDTFFGPRKVADGEGQFSKGYPRLHNHGQDIHEVSGFSRDSRDDETVWSHRLLLPWDLAKANDTSYLMAGVVWQSERLAALGGDTTFVQPLLPKNTGATASVLPQAIPCFENSPIFWNGHLIWEGTYAPKQIKMPWSRVADGAEAELALKSDLDGLGGGATLQGEATGVHLHQNDASLSVYSDPTTSTLLFSIYGAASENGPHYVPTTTVTDALAAQVAGKADAKHLHAIEDVTNLGSTLNAKASLSYVSSTYVTKAALQESLALKQNQLTAGENVTLAEDGTISATCPSAETGWVSPGDWTLSVTPAEEYAVIDSSVVVWTNNVQQVIGTATSSTLSAAAKMVSLEMLDVAQPAPTVNFACEGATITRGDNAQSALVTAEAEGLYRVSATDDTGRMRTAYLSIRAKEKSTKVEQAYLADVPGTARATANDAMLAALQTRNTSTTVQSGITAAVATGDLCFDASGAPLSTAPLAPRFFCVVDPSRAWGPDAVAVAPHFAVTAAHWNPAQAKTATFRTPEGASVTVSGTYGISLVEWARQRGYSESEIRDADLADIWVWQFDNGTIPETCIPAVMDRSAWEHYYRSDLTGVACYAVTQNGYLSFGELLHPDGGAYSIGSFTPERTRADLLATLSPPTCALIYGGDSGRPVMMIHAGEPVLLSTFWTAGSGPSMIKACNILDDLIKTRSGGTESLKRISAP